VLKGLYSRTRVYYYYKSAPTEACGGKDERSYKVRDSRRETRGIIIIIIIIISPCYEEVSKTTYESRSMPLERDDER